MSPLEARIAVVTGASSGIGRAIALALANEGARVCLVGRSLERLKSIVDGGTQVSENISLFEADLVKDEDIKALAANIRKEHGDIDILVHSAGEYSVGRVDQASIEGFDSLYRINVRAPYLLTQAFLPALTIKCGQIVFINSSAGLAARAGVGQYAATKHALKAVADSLRGEVNSDGIRVLSIFPGRTASPMQEAVCKLEGISYQPERLIQPEDIASAVINSLGLTRSAEVTDVHIRPMSKS